MFSYNELDSRCVGVPAMTLPNPLLNRTGRLRGGWRLAIFVVAFLVAARLLLDGFALAVFLGSGGATNTEQLGGIWGRVAELLITLAAALALGWSCGYVLEDVPLRALGWTLHQGWWRDLLAGSGVGAASLGFAALIALTGGGLRFSLTNSQTLSAIIETTVGSALFFVVAAASEETLFRGYPLQTTLRAWAPWAAIVPSSMLFALAHLGNPNVMPIFTIINTTLAGVWLAVAYWRVRSLWFPLGVHWSWNWAQGALLGLPVSGITQLTPAPVLQAAHTGPAWLTGGAYGIEGGVACSLALLASTVFIWRAPWLAADAGMKQWTDGEIPKPTEQPLTIFRHAPTTNQPPASDQS